MVTPNYADESKGPPTKNRAVLSKTEKAMAMLKAAFEQWQRDKAELERFRRGQLIPRYVSIPRSIGAMSVVSQQPRRSQMPNQMIGQGPTLYQVYHVGTQQVQQNFHLYPHFYPPPDQGQVARQL